MGKDRQLSEVKRDYPPWPPGGETSPVAPVSPGLDNLTWVPQVGEVISYSYLLPTPPIEKSNFGKKKKNKHHEGVPGWLSQLSVDFGSSHDLTVCEFEPRIGFCTLL